MKTAKFLKKELKVSAAKKYLKAPKAKKGKPVKPSREVSRFTLFKGLSPVRIPAEWVAAPEKVRWAARSGVQYIDFSPNGGPTLAFSMSYGGRTGEEIPPYWVALASPNCWEVDPQSVEGWTDQEHGGTYAEAYITSQIFGTSAQVVDLVPPEPDDGVRVYPPARLCGVEVDPATPVRYYWRGDMSGGCGTFYAFVRTAEGKVLEACIGACNDAWREPWRIPFLHEEDTYEEFAQKYPDARQNPAKIWPRRTRERHLRGLDFEGKELFFF